jgi:predicted DNA-binding WGR domain protein
MQTKFIIIISQGGNASQKEKFNNITNSWTRRNANGQRGMQKFMDKVECKWTKRNAKIS